MNAPKGVGALYVRRGVELEPRVYGAGHEGGRRAGTENAPDSRAWEAAAIAEVKRLRDLLWMPLHERSGDEVVLNGHPDQRLPNTLSVAFVGRVGAASTRPAALPA